MDHKSKREFRLNPQEEIPATVRPLFKLEVDSPVVPAPSQQDIEDRKGEARRIVKRLAAIVEDHRQSAIPLGIELAATDLRAVIAALRDHANGGPGLPIPATREAIHAHVLTRLFEELVEEPSNILFTTVTGPETTRYDAMNPTFWLECLELMEKTYT
ncbi:MAG: hypothetical protein ACNA8L_09485 [Luteolibacter sp.]